MFRKLPALFICIFWVLTVFSQAPLIKGERIKVKLSELSAANILPGEIAIKLSAEQAATARPQVRKGIVSFGIAAVDTVCHRLGAGQLRPLFASMYEDARRSGNTAAIENMNRWGFQLWYRVSFSKTQSVKNAAQAFAALPQVQAAEPFGTIHTNEWVPNDPRFNEQWHYKNTEQAGGTSGADIKLTQAWDIEKGKPDVRVSVHDGGIDYQHPDLAQNMWTGIGYNFITDNAQITVMPHGTHVAGTLAGINNNALGVSGVAGGDGTPASGIRMMSMQILGGSTDATGIEALSYLYAANHGAAISQNSWGYTNPGFFPQYTADAIDYFIENGGGTVMKGGLVIFAAGNDGSEAPYYPGAYSRVINVAASSNRDIKPGYSNYGSHIDITAPGGDANTQILSTQPFSGYNFMFGTSMASPQVSGVAALILSHLRNRVSPSDIRWILEHSTDDIYAINPAYAGKLGSGRLNAYKALQKADAIAQQPLIAPVSNFAAAVANCNQVRLQWNNTTPNTQVMIAVSNNTDIGLPNGKQYNTGDTIDGGGVVVYKGSASSFDYSMFIDKSTMTFRIWVVDAAGTNYSAGLYQNFTVPSTVSNVSYSSTTNSIQLNWQRSCPNRNVLLMYNTGYVFGKPSGDPAAINTIPGGAQALLHGTQTSFTHTGLQPDATVYYALYAYEFINGSYVYANPVVLTAATLCTQTILPLLQSFTDEKIASQGWKVMDGSSDGYLLPDGKSWQHYEGVGSVNNDSACLILPSYSVNGNNSKETLRSPAFEIARGLDSLIVNFDYAYKAYSDDESLADSLELALSKDCGFSWTTIWKKGGEQLATVAGFDTNEFIPDSAKNWKHQSFDILQMVQPGESVSLMWRGTNKYGQNLFLDNIHIYSVKLPAALKEKGWLVYPNPLGRSFHVKHLQITNGLQMLTLYNQQGQKVWQYAVPGGNAAPDMVFNLPALPAGLYVLQLQYAGKKESVKLVKMPGL